MLEGKSLVGRIARALVIVSLALLALSVVSLLLLNLIDPPTTMVQTQRRVESWFGDDDYVKRQTWVTIDSIDADLRWAVVASEDGRFFEHHGVDWQAVDKAVEEYQSGGRLRGASTITQQLVKNLFLTTHSTWIRKGLELPLAYMADLLLSKRRILEIYLNIVEWGPGVWGAEAAARHHYGRSARILTRDQAARLAACLPDPLRRRPQRMDRMSSSIKDRMNQLGY